MNLLLNILFAILAFFVVRYIGGLIAPQGPDKDKVVTVIAVIVGVVVFLSNVAVQVH